MLLTIYNELNTLAQRGDERGAQELLKKHFNEFPEDLQGEIVTRLYLSGLQDDAEETGNLLDVQVQALEAHEAILAIKKELERASTEPSQSA